MKQLDKVLIKGLLEKVNTEGFSTGPIIDIHQNCITTSSFSVDVIEESRGTETNFVLYFYGRIFGNLEFTAFVVNGDVGIVAEQQVGYAYA